MAQTSLKKYFPVKRGRTEEEHESVKKRKVDEITIEDKQIPSPADINTVISSSQIEKITTFEFISPKQKNSVNRKVDEIGSEMSSPDGKCVTSTMMSSSPQLEKFTAFEFISPKKKNSVSRRLTYSLLTEPTPAERATNIKPHVINTSKLPAFQKFKNLAEPKNDTVKSQSDLSLPYSYKLLEEKFQSVDTICSLLQKRQELCTFHKLKDSVQEMIRRNFQERNLAQMKQVYPEAFYFRQEKHIPGTVRVKYEQYQLTVECTAHEEEGTKVEKLPPGKGLDPNALIKRRKIFHRNLVNVVVDHHKDFLASLDPPIHVPENKLFRWHPAFQLDTVPEVKEAELPHLPITESYTTAKDVLQATRTKMSNRVKAALETVVKETNKAESDNVVCESQSIDPSLRGVSSGLLQRIRQKEAVRAKTEMMRNPLKEKQLSIMNRLPEMCRILRSLFVTEGKAAILWDDVINKLVDSHSSSLSTDQVEEHLDFLLDILPTWAKKVSVRKSTYLKINKNTGIKTLISKLQQKESQI